MPENEEFVKEVVQDKYSNLPNVEITRVEWEPKIQRCGVIARKIGAYPLWLKDGSRIDTTLLQVSQFLYFLSNVSSFIKKSAILI